MTRRPLGTCRYIGLRDALAQPGPGATVRNITLQDGCEADHSDHLTMMYSPRALSIILNALDPGKHPTLVCTFNPWLFGGGGFLAHHAPSR